MTEISNSSNAPRGAHEKEPEANDAVAARAGAESDNARHQRPASCYEVYAVAGTALQHALSAQQVIITQLLKALVESGALSPDKARDVLLAAGKGLEKLPLVKEGSREWIPYFLVGSRLEHQAKALRGMAAKMGRP
jgi:hypothetical protein